MSDLHLNHEEWLLQLSEYLKTKQYARTSAGALVAEARQFLAVLKAWHIEVAVVTPADVKRYLDRRVRAYRRCHGHPPSTHWRAQRINAVRMLLRLVCGQWPPTPKPATPAERYQRQLCEQYVKWMVDIRGLAPASVSDRYQEARRFVSWLGRRVGQDRIANLSVADLDRYLKDRSSSLRRSSTATIVNWMRVFLRWLHSTGQTRQDLSATVIAPSRYALEGIPSALPWQDVERILSAVRRDDTAKGIRDYAILMLLSTYGIRSGEIVALRLDDIDWHKNIIRVRHTKTGITSYLPLLPEVGNAILKYLQRVRPKTTFREIFVRKYAPFEPFKGGTSVYAIIQEWIEAAGVISSGKRGPHAFRHARAVSMLRATVSLKEIGDVLGHRSAISTMVYLKLATEDLRAIALEIPAEVKA